MRLSESWKQFYDYFIHYEADNIYRIYELALVVTTPPDYPHQGKGSPISITWHYAYDTFCALIKNSLNQLDKNYSYYDKDFFIKPDILQKNIDHIQDIYAVLIDHNVIAYRISLDLKLNPHKLALGFKEYEL